MRLYGALEVPIVMRILSGGGLNHANVVLPPNEDQDCDFCFGHIDQNIIDWWKKWEYASAKPLKTPLWDSLLTNSELDLFWTLSLDDKLSAWCFYDFVFPYATPEHINANVINKGNKYQCDRKKSRDVGYLFVLIENNSEYTMSDIDLFYKYRAHDSLYIQKFTHEPLQEVEDSINYISRRDLLDKLGSADIFDQKIISQPEMQFFLPQLKSKQSVLWILSSYIKDSKGYPLSYVSDVYFPTSIRYSIGDEVFVERIREPARDKAVKTYLPLGWYNQ